MQVIKGRPRHPQSQGFIECGNGPFKEALQNWMRDNNMSSWHRGAYIVNRQMNLRPHDARNNLAPYSIYHAVKEDVRFENLLGRSTKHIKMKLGWNIVTTVLRHIQKNHPDILLNDEKIQQIAEEGDKVHEAEEAMSQEERDSMNHSSTVKEVVRRCIFDICQVLRLRKCLTITSYSDSNDDEEDDNKGDDDDDSASEDDSFDARMQYRSEVE